MRCHSVSSLSAVFLVSPPTRPPSQSAAQWWDLWHCRVLLLTPQVSPPPRSRQTHKPKKDCKTDLFGFDDGDGPQDGRSSGGSGNVTDGGSSYKIKYFGFDDMSDSDGADDADECGSVEETRRVAKAASPKPTPVVTIDEVLDLDPPESPEPPDPFERLRLKEKPAAKEDKKSSDKLESRNRTGTHTHTHAIVLVLSR